MAAIFRFGEDVARFGKHGFRERLARRLDRALLGQKIDFAPVFPRLQAARRRVVAGKRTQNPWSR